MKATIVLFVVVFIAIASPALGDIEIFVRADLSKIKFSEGREFSEEMEFRGGKAVWQEYGDFYFAFYSEDALKRLAESDSTRVVLVPPNRESIRPAFGNLYFVTRNILWGVGEEYGLDPEIYYVWPVKFLPANMGLKDENGNICHLGVAPFGDYAIDEIKSEGRQITKDSLALLANRN